ncbi:phosphate system positive regulatory protein pho81 [Coemansia guatemalensis]|uniref:Phosphate system positive regulatory protein pho81 n=1 Tax=Coemansia guatemalensis TaxID=2761395 RepID=A0A9W8I3M2_9FUNG|nr:phosphate system positive regulatory protein pho81 [Coemansia guatemalensis]
MKFGKHIQAQTIPEWGAHYMSYKTLKKIIKELEAPLSPGADPSEASQRRLQTVKAAFFFQVDRELEKVNMFYLQKEADTKVRLKSLIEKQRNLRSRGPRNRTATIRALHEAFLNSRHELDKLQSFVEINGTGFRKILKKWDKRSKSSTKELYLARQVEVQPCFNKEVIAELSDAVTKCLSELEHTMDEDSERIPSSKIPPRRLDLILQPSQDTGIYPQASAEQSHVAVDSTNIEMAVCQPSTEDAISPGVDDSTPAIPRNSSAGFLLDAGLPRSVQIDRMEAELFHNLELASMQSAAELLEKYKTQQTDAQKACVTRVLWRACSEIKDTDKQKMLLASGLADLRSVDDINERTLAHEASIHGSLVILEAAIAAGNSADELDYYDRRPVHYASINNHKQCLQYLLDQGGSVRAIDDDGNHAFGYAVSNGHTDCVRMILQYDSKIAQSTPDNPVLVLACEKGHEEIVKLLLEAGAEIAPNLQGMHPLHVAARAGFAGIIRILLEHGAPVDVVDKDLGWTPVFYAANEGQAECIRVLLGEGCNVNVLDENGRGPSYFAANEGHLDCVDLLLEASSAAQSNSKEEVTHHNEHTINDDNNQPHTEDSTQQRIDAGDVLAGGSSLDLDGIPSLSLPPPLIPFRVYGHNFLAKHTRIHIRMQAHGRVGMSPVSFFDDRDTVALKLVAAAKPDTGMVPHTVMLPMETPSTTFGFQTENLDQFHLEFLLYPSFGLRPIGKAVALSNLFTGSSSGVARLPLLDRYLKLVAEVSFEFLVIRPFEGAQLQIGGKVETYWKSTNPGQQQQNSAAAFTAASALGNSPSRPLLPSGISSTMLTSPSSTVDLGIGGAGQASTPMIISSSLAAEHVCVQVQICRDGVPVVSPRMHIDVGGPSEARLCIHDLSHIEFQRAMGVPHDVDNGQVRGGPKPDTTAGNAAEWHEYLHDSGFTLGDVLRILPARFGISIQVLDNSRDWSGNNDNNMVHASYDINEYIDRILETVYASQISTQEDATSNTEHTGTSSRRSSGEFVHKAAGGQQRRNDVQRNTVFCSYSPIVCVTLNWKQPNYAVFLLTSGRECPGSSIKTGAGNAEIAGSRSSADAPSFGTSSSHLSLKEAVRFACANNLLGLICSSSLLTRVPALIENVKNSGLLLVSFGSENYDEQQRQSQKSRGVDATICNGVILYEADQSLEYAI